MKLIKKKSINAFQYFNYLIFTQNFGENFLKNLENFEFTN